MEDNWEKEEEGRRDLELCEFYWQEELRMDPEYIDWLESLEHINEY